MRRCAWCQAPSGTADACSLCLADLENEARRLTPTPRRSPGSGDGWKAGAVYFTPCYRTLGPVMSSAEELAARGLGRLAKDARGRATR